MSLSQSLFSFGFVSPTVPPKMLPKITRLDMGLQLPRLDSKIVDQHGNTDPAKKRELEELIEKYLAVYVLGGRIGKATLVKGKGDDPGIRFVGQFKAIVNPPLANQNQGNYFVSARCHVPRFFEEMLYSQVLDAKKADPDTVLDFLVGIGLKPPKAEKPSMTGYEWTVEPLVDMSAVNDPVDMLFQRGKDRLAGALPAPSPAAESGATVAPTPASVESIAAASAGRSHRRS